MADNHGNTPAAWIAVGVSMIGIVVGSIALMLDPVSLPAFWVGLAIAVLAFPLFLVLARMGYNDSNH